MLAFLGQRKSVELQALSRFFYGVQIPRAMPAIIEIKLRKVRLHLFNHDYVILFNMQQWTKEKRMLKGPVEGQPVPHIWNCQSIEVRGSIFVTGGSIANTKTYLKSTYKIEEANWRMQALADMAFARDAHGVIAYRN